MKILVTGGAGFIGSNLINRFTQLRKINGKPVDKIVVIDNLSLGKKEFIQSSIDTGRVDFYKQDLLNLESLLGVFKKYNFDLIFHLSANSDISHGSKDTDWDLKQGTLVTYNILESMRLTNVSQVVFSSTSAIYGEASVSPTPEDYGPLLPISLYGASKLACEGLIAAFCHNYNLQALIFRLANIVGRNSTHGVLVDFIRKLNFNPAKLQVLGDGSQEKSYLYIDDCIEGMLFGYAHLNDQVSYYNLAGIGTTSVSKIVKMVVEALGKTSTVIQYSRGRRGWLGDVPQVSLDTNKLRKAGWVAKWNSDEAIKKAIADLLIQ